MSPFSFFVLTALLATVASSQAPSQSEPQQVVVDGKVYSFFPGGESREERDTGDEREGRRGGGRGRGDGQNNRGRGSGNDNNNGGEHGQNGGGQDSKPNGNPPRGNQPGGNSPGGNQPGGNSPGGNQSGGNSPGGNQPGGNEGGRTGNNGGGGFPGQIGNNGNNGRGDGRVDNFPGNKRGGDDSDEHRGGRRDSDEHRGGRRDSNEHGRFPGGGFPGDRDRFPGFPNRFGCTRCGEISSNGFSPAPFVNTFFDRTGCLQASISCRGSSNIIIFRGQQPLTLNSFGGGATAFCNPAGQWEANTRQFGTVTFQFAGCSSFQPGFGK